MHIRRRKQQRADHVGGGYLIRVLHLHQYYWSASSVTPNSIGYMWTTEYLSSNMTRKWKGWPNSDHSDHTPLPQLEHMITIQLFYPTFSTFIPEHLLVYNNVLSTLLGSVRFSLISIWPIFCPLNFLDYYRVHCNMGFFTEVPVCRGCDEETTRLKTKPENDRGNAGRPYYKCQNNECRKKFYCFDDARGVHPDNPLCFCRERSRRIVAGKATSDYLFLKFQCARNDCDCSFPEQDQGGLKTVPRAKIGDWIKLGKL